MTYDVSRICTSYVILLLKKEKQKMGVNKQQILKNRSSIKIKTDYTKLRSRSDKRRIEKPKFETSKEEFKERKTPKRKKRIRTYLTTRRKIGGRKSYDVIATLKDNGELKNRSDTKLDKRFVPRHIAGRTDIENVYKIDKDTTAYEYRNVTRIETTKIKEMRSTDTWQMIAIVKVKRGNKIVTRTFGGQHRSDQITFKKAENEIKRILVRIENKVYDKPDDRPFGRKTFGTPESVEFKINYYRNNPDFKDLKEKLTM